MTFIVKDAKNTARILDGTTKFVSLENKKYYHEIFENGIWNRFLPILSIVIERISEKNLVTDAIAGLVNLIQISSSKPEYGTQKSSCMNALINFTGLFKEGTLTMKNIQAIRGMFNLMTVTPCLLKENWKECVDFLSRIDRLLEIVKNGGYANLRELGKGSGGGSGDMKAGHFMNVEKEKEKAGSLFKYVRYEEVGAIFEKTVDFDDKNLEYILTYLIQNAM